MGIRIFLGIALITAFNSRAGTYSTSFPQTQNPISEGGRWINGMTAGLDWANIATTPGLAFGTETGAGGFDDSTALLTGAWGSNQTASARVHIGTRAGGGVYKEVEIRLRSSISAHSCTGYEINFSLNSGAGAYTQIVRWNGPVGSFTLLDSGGGSQYQINEGDEVKAVISGNTITSYIRGQKVVQVTDNTFTSGNPGMGFYLQGTGTNDFGFTSYSVTDGSGPVTNQPPIAVATASPTNGVAPFTVIFSSTGSFDPEGTALSYSWTFGDGGISTVANPTHTYATTGTFAASLSVSDGTNVTISSILNLTVKPAPPSNLRITTGS
jgi:PKD domain